MLAATGEALRCAVRRIFIEGALSGRKNQSPYKLWNYQLRSMLTITEIAVQFVSEWVLIEDPQTKDALEVQSGKVLYHSKDRDAVYREAVRLRPKRFAMLYTGTLPRDTAIVL
jgi:hypothetical protein